MTERPLPEDPDVDVDETSTGLPLPVHLHPGLIALVFLGGTLGSLARYGVTGAVGSPADLPVGTLVVNVAGSFLLGALIELLALRGSDVGRRRAARLTFGTGFLGGFTTYSAFAVETTRLLDDSLLIGLSWSIGSIVAGVTAAALGILTARTVAR